MRKKTNKWIQGALRSGKEGSFSAQIGIPEKDDIPMKLIDAIIRAPIGSRIDNPTSKGKSEFNVTRLLKQRAVLAKNLKRARKR